MENSTINQPVTISTDTPLHPASDFRFLRGEGIRFIQQLAAGTWTDHNTHDPGITILDLLCYAITDISYRLDYDIKDLLATPSGNAYASLYSPAQILTTNPVTVADYRKLLIDITGVKNAWLEKQTGAGMIPLYYYTDTQTLSLTDISFFKKQALIVKGIYNVSIAPDKSGVGQVAAARLNATRNLCEDFNEVKELPVQQVSVSGIVEVGQTSDINKTAAGLLFRVAGFISPRLRFRSLAQMLATGKTVDEIFEGPALVHGFIDDEELAAYQRKTALHVSDIIREMMDEPGVLFVNSVSLRAIGVTGSNDWQLLLDADKVVELDIASTLNGLTFKKSRTILTVNADLVIAMVQEYQQAIIDAPLEKKARDVIVSEGEYRPLDEYFSIQHHFPQTYGIGEAGLPESASALRKAQANQLKGYLLFFEQILAAYTAQIAGLKDLFAFSNASARTYFCQPLKDIVPGANEILRSGNQKKVAVYIESSEQANLRKNRFLDHLIARFGESLSEYSLNAYSYMQWLKQSSAVISHVAGDQVIEAATDKNAGEQARHVVSKGLVADKLRFLTNYPIISNERGKAFNYTKDVNDSSNYSGLQKRIAAKLGIETAGWWNPADGKEGFYLVEHILLLPIREDANALSDYITKYPDYLVAKPVERFENGGKDKDGKEWVTCFSKEHGLINGDRITISKSKNYMAPGYTVTYLSVDSFKIAATYKADPEDKNAVWERLIDARFLTFINDQRVPGQADFFSLQLTCLFPAETGRFKSSAFRSFVETTIRKETPAHLTVYVRWLSIEMAKQFGAIFHRFLDEKAGLHAYEDAKVAKWKLAQRSYRNRLIELLIPSAATYPLADMPAAQPELVVPYNQPAIIVLPYSQPEIVYTVADEFGNKMNGDGNTGTDGPLTITTTNLTKDRYTFSITAKNGTTGLATRLYQTVAVRIGINTKLDAVVKDAPVAYGNKAIVVIKDAQSDTTYQLLDGAKKPLSAAITTDANVVSDLEITTTDAVFEDTVVTISVTNTHVAQGGMLEIKPVITVLPNTGLKPVLEKPEMDYGGTANVVLAGTQTTATYQLYRQDIDDDTVNKEVVSIGQPLSGKSAKLKLPIPDLTEDVVVSIVVRKKDSGLQLPLPDNMVVPVKPDAGKQLSVVEPNVKAGDTATIRVSNTQPGVLYQLRQLNEDKTFTNVGNPVYHHKNYGIGKARLEVEFAVDMFTTDFVLLPTGIINQTTTFNVIATKATTLLQANLGNIIIEIKP